MSKGYAFQRMYDDDEYDYINNAQLSVSVRSTTTTKPHSFMVDVQQSEAIMNGKYHSRLTPKQQASLTPLDAIPKDLCRLLSPPLVNPRRSFYYPPDVSSFVQDIKYLNHPVRMSQKSRGLFVQEQEQSVQPSISQRRQQISLSPFRIALPSSKLSGPSSTRPIRSIDGAWSTTADLNPPPPFAAKPKPSRVQQKDHQYISPRSLMVSGFSPVSLQNEQQSLAFLECNIADVCGTQKSVKSSQSVLAIEVIIINDANTFMEELSFLQYHFVEGKSSLQLKRRLSSGMTLKSADIHRIQARIHEQQQSSCRMFTIDGSKELSSLQEITKCASKRQEKGEAYQSLTNSTYYYYDSLLRRIERVSDITRESDLFNRLQPLVMVTCSEELNEVKQKSNNSGNQFTNRIRRSNTSVPHIQQLSFTPICEDDVRGRQSRKKRDTSLAVSQAEERLGRLIHTGDLAYNVEGQTGRVSSSMRQVPKQMSSQSAERSFSKRGSQVSEKGEWKTNTPYDSVSEFNSSVGQSTQNKIPIKQRSESTQSQPRVHLLEISPPILIYESHSKKESKSNRNIKQNDFLDISLKRVNSSENNTSSSFKDKKQRQIETALEQGKDHHNQLQDTATTQVVYSRMLKARTSLSKTPMLAKIVRKRKPSDSQLGYVKGSGNKQLQSNVLPSISIKGSPRLSEEQNHQTLSAVDNSTQVFYQFKSKWMKQTRKAQMKYAETPLEQQMTQSNPVKETLERDSLDLLALLRSQQLQRDEEVSPGRNSGEKFVPISAARRFGVDRIHEEGAARKFLAVFLDELGVSGSRGLYEHLLPTQQEKKYGYKKEEINMMLGQFLILANSSLKFMEEGSTAAQEVFEKFQRNSESDDGMAGRVENLFSAVMYIKNETMREAFSEFALLENRGELMKSMKGIFKETSLQGKGKFFWKDFLHFKAVVVDRRVQGGCEEEVTSVLALVDTEMLKIRQKLDKSLSPSKTQRIATNNNNKNGNNFTHF